MADRKYPRHDFWGAGEADCPPELKAPNGELCDMRCKVCGDGWRESHDVCMAALVDPLRAALAELVSLKAIKDSIEQLKTVPNAEHPIVIADRERMEVSYRNRKDAAWKAARRALGLPAEWDLSWIEAEDGSAVPCGVGVLPKASSQTSNEGGQHG